MDRARESAAIAADSSRVSMMFCWDCDFSVVVADFFDRQYSLRVPPLIYGSHGRFALESGVRLVAGPAAQWRHLPCFRDAPKTHLRVTGTISREHGDLCCDPREA